MRMFPFVTNENSVFYKNCKRQRKREAKICQCCPFREGIEEQELEIGKGIDWRMTAFTGRMIPK